MFLEGKPQEFTVEDTGEIILFDRTKHEIVDARSFPGPEWKGDLQDKMREKNLIVVKTDDPRLARGLRKI